MFTQFSTLQICLLSAIELHCTNMWHDHSIVNIKWLKHNLELKLKDINIQTWHSEIHANRLCSNYRIFKNEVGFEKYLTYLSPTDRINLCKITNYLFLLVVISLEMPRGYVTYATLGTKVKNIIMYLYVHL